MAASTALVDDAWRHLMRGDWHAARAGFEAALAAADSPAAHDGLGLALWWLNEIEAAHRHRTLAYHAYRAAGDLGRAALMAVWLGREQLFLDGNLGAMRGWIARADRLLAAAPAGPAHGWVPVLRASVLAPPSELERAAGKALEIARDSCDPALEGVSLAFQAIAQVSLGRVEEGLARLDEAMVMVMGGEVEDLAAISEIYCVLLSACELAGDLVRADNWCRAAAAFAERHRSSFLSAYCRTTYGGLLVATGRWSEAERELSAAIDTFTNGHRALRTHATIKLADLRVRQGRLEEAERLLAGFEDREEAAAPLARLHLTKGETSLARAVLAQALRNDPPMPGHAPLLALLVETQLALEDVGGARDTAERLDALAQQMGSDFAKAEAELARGRVAIAAREPGARHHLLAALELVRSHERSLLAGRVRLELASTLAGTDPAGAIAWGRGALATFERIGADHEADAAAALLRRLGSLGRAAPRVDGGLTRREEEVLGLVASGLTNREIAERLCITAKTAEHHVGRVLAKIGARSRAEAAAWAVRRGGSGRPVK